jgi:hypothetical protein
VAVISDDEDFLLPFRFVFDFGVRREESRGELFDFLDVSLLDGSVLSVRSVDTDTDVKLEEDSCPRLLK